MTKLPTLVCTLIRSAIVAAMVLLLGACEPPAESIIDDQSIRPAHLFRVAPSATLERYQFVSRVEAAQTVDLAFEVSGPLTSVTVREGQTVPAGSTLAALATTDFVLAVQEAEVVLRLALLDLERKHSLLEKRAISQAVVDDATAQADLAQVRLAQARAALADTTLSAPFDAYVSKRFVDKHTNVKPGDPILRLLDLSELRLIAHVPEAMLATVAADRIAALYAQFAFVPNQRFDLTYRENAGEADAVAQTYEVTFALPRPKDWNILPGMTATVTVELNAPAIQGLQVTIPTSALLTGAEGNFYVWEVDSLTGAVTARPVEVGNATDRGVLVTHGLAGGELIVSTGASQLQAGMRVQPLGTIDG